MICLTANCKGKVPFKWCGKTTTAKQMAKSVLDLGNTAILRDALSNQADVVVGW